MHHALHATTQPIQSPIVILKHHCEVRPDPEMGGIVVGFGG
jgi:hypothetical protein